MAATRRCCSSSRLLHDTQRLNDGHDPEHGFRAAQFARRLHERALFRLSTPELELLCHACADHTSGDVTSDPTIGARWDADRLNLRRINVRPDPRLLSTEPAKQDDQIKRAGRFEGRDKSGQDNFDGYLRPAPC
jgi:uncharacterized protein